MVRRYLRNAAVALALLGLALPAPAVAAELSAAPTASTSATVPATTTTSDVSTLQASLDPSIVPPGYLYYDLPLTHWAAPAVLQLRMAGVLSPDPKGLFRPNDPIKRSEFFKMILAARRIDVGSSCGGLFTDVPCSAWYAPVAEMAYRMAIAEGQGDGSFGPDRPLTREELAVIMVRALGRRWDAAQLGWAEISRRLSVFQDEDDIVSWARPSVGYALGAKLTTGYEDGTFLPKKLTTRAEAAAVVGRLLLAGDGLKTIEVDGKKITFASEIDNMRTTMYTSGEPGVGTVTYTGLTVRIGTVAVDPTVIPLGRLLYVEGYGYVVAADIGSAIKGNSVDLFTYSLEQAIQFGVRPRRVFVLP